MNLTRIVNNENAVLAVENPDMYRGKNPQQYGLFCEQYLERPVISGDYEMALSPTACSIKGIPVIDDF